MTIDIHHVRFKMPRHNEHWFVDTERILACWEEQHGDEVTNEELRAHANGTVQHNGCYEFGDVRVRHAEAASMRWAECILLHRETGECWNPCTLFKRRMAQAQSA